MLLDAVAAALAAGAHPQSLGVSPARQSAA
jgi:hypothetical protein